MLLQIVEIGLLFTDTYISSTFDVNGYNMSLSSVQNLTLMTDKNNSRLSCKIELPLIGNLNGLLDAVGILTL